MNRAIESWRAVVACMVLALTLAGCSWLPTPGKDETTGWSAEQLYREAHDALVQGNYTRATKLFEGGPCCVHTSTGLSWSPDGTTIALIGSAAGSHYTLVGKLYALDPDDGHVRVLARHVPFAGPPEWQPVP